jgi:putative SOS response-associated peptidase YedK
MCGRYRRKSDKQRIAEAFAVSVGLEELYLGPEDDIAPGSMQPVVTVNRDGERQIEMMRWAFKLPDRLLFVARSEGIENSKFWKDSFKQRRCIVPADSIFEWVRPESRPDDCPARSRDRTCRPIGSTLGGQADG